jgi:hypothetical protein
MSTHISNSPPTTKVTLGTNSTLNVDTINVNKEIPKEIFNKYIPKRFVLQYDDIDQDTLELTLRDNVDRHFLEHFALYIDNNFIERVSQINDTLDQYKLDYIFNKIIFSQSLFEQLQQETNIVVIYTPV